MGGLDSVLFVAKPHVNYGGWIISPGFPCHSVSRGHIQYYEARSLSVIDIYGHIETPTQFLRIACDAHSPICGPGVCPPTSCICKHLDACTNVKVVYCDPLYLL